MSIFSQPDYLLFIVVSTVIDLVVAIAILFFRLPPSLQAILPASVRKLISPRLTMGRCIFAAGLTGAVWLIKSIVAFVALDLSVFAIITLAYVHIVISLPLLGVLVLRSGSVEIDGVGTRARATALVRTCALLALLGLPVGVYASFIEPNTIVLERTHVALPGERAGDDLITIAVLSDVQTDRMTEKHLELTERVMALAPDIIIIPGDFYEPSAGLDGHDWDDFENQEHRFRAFLKGLAAPGGVYFIEGNCELQYDARSMLEGTDVVLLDDATTTIKYGDRKILLAGAGYELQSDRGRAFRETLLDDIESNDDAIVLLVSHVPDSILHLPPDARIDLTIAGHTHGGQVQVPGYGPIFTASDVPRDIAAGGLSEFRGNRIYVSRGVGLERGQAPALRLFCPPEISLITLQ
ncbi:MAG: metallophosphoesterase [Planctomycetota bacterium]